MGKSVWFDNMRTPEGREFKAMEIHDTRVPLP